MLYSTTVMHHILYIHVAFRGLKGMASHYKPKMVVVCSSELMPLFGVIQDIYVSEADDVHFIIKELSTHAFVNHFHAHHTHIHRSFTHQKYCI